MSTVLIDNREQLHRHRDAWRDVYSVDTQATVHRSWPWQYSWACCEDRGWGIVAAKTRSGIQAFLPFRSVRTPTGSVELRLGGSRLAAVGGMLCVPDQEDRALGEIARFLVKRLRWDRVVWNDVGDARAPALLQHIRPRHGRTRSRESTTYSVMPLPSTWDEYLSGLSYTTRANLRKRIRQLERLDSYSVQAADADSVRAASNVLLRLWQRRWGTKPHCEVREIRALFETCAEHGMLRLTIIYDDTAPVAGLAGFLDRPRSTFYCFMTAHNADYAGLSPSKVVMAQAIRWSIETGFRNFSFGRGDEPYKVSLGVQQSRLADLSVMRVHLHRRARNLLTRLAQGSIRSMVSRDG
jgi:CelD/BcsL family acetyltransferase involved in cellulose biosynthesis